MLYFRDLLSVGMFPLTPIRSPVNTLWSSLNYHFGCINGRITVKVSQKSTTCRAPKHKWIPISTRYIHAKKYFARYINTACDGQSDIIHGLRER